MTLDFKKVRAISKIKTILNDNSFEEFKIGKTDDFVRREREHRQNGYSFFETIISCETLNEVNRLEKLLIDYFKTNSICSNEISGGGNSSPDSNEFYIYLIGK